MESYSRTRSVWQRASAEERQQALDYCEGYKTFLDTARTERLAVTRPGRSTGIPPPL